MTDTRDRGRLRRLKFWIILLTAVPCTALVLAGYGKAASGYAVGGAVVLLNLLGTERAVTAFMDGVGGRRFLGLVLYLVKLAATAAVIAAALITGAVSPLALMLGITTLLMALVFDILIFPRDIGETDNTEEP